MHAYAVAVRGAHTGAVLGLSCAVSKPLLVSCGADRTVRVWDYRAWQCQLVSPQAALTLTLILALALALTLTLTLTLPLSRRSRRGRSASRCIPTACSCCYPSR